MYEITLKVRFEESRDIQCWIRKPIELPFVPFIGLKLKIDGKEIQISEVIWNVKHEEFKIIADVEPDVGGHLRKVRGWDEISLRCA